MRDQKINSPKSLSGDLAPTGLDSLESIPPKKQPPKDQPAKLKSPCIGVCSTGIGDTVCRGCKRYCHEIIQWNSYQETEKQAIMNRLAALLAQVVRNRIAILDADLLRNQLRLQGIRFDEQSDPHSWVFALLKAGATQLTDLEVFGCKRLAEAQDLSLVALRDAIDQDFYVLSSVHYERYFHPQIPAHLPT